MIVFIIVYNRLTLVKNTVDWCVKHNLTPILIDNHSDYPPLIEYLYDECPYHVYHLAENRGHKVVSTLNLEELFGVTGRFIVTDPDLDFTGVPGDFLEVMNRGLDLYPSYNKCGLSLEIDDLPNTKEGKFIKYIAEPSYWRYALDSMYFEAHVDTTFVLHRKEQRHHHTITKSLRVNRPYTVRHIPWYYGSFETLPEDEQYYFRTANSSCSGKERMKL